MQEGAEEEVDADANKDDDIGDPLLADGEDKQGAEEPVERPRKTSKYMTKYERARILGTRALQIRFQFLYLFFLKLVFIKLAVE